MVLPLDLCGIGLARGCALALLQETCLATGQMVTPQLRENPSRVWIGIKTYMEAYLKCPPHILDNFHAAMIAENVCVCDVWEVNNSHKGLIISMLDVVTHSAILTADVSFSTTEVELQEEKGTRVVARRGVVIWPEGNVRRRPYFYTCGKLPIVDPTTKSSLAFYGINNRAHPVYGNVNVIYELRTKGVEFAINKADVLFGKEERVAFANKFRVLLDNLYLTQILKGSFQSLMAGITESL